MLSCCCVVTELCLTLLQPHGLQVTRLLCPWNFPCKNTRVGCHLLLQRIFLTRGSNPCLLLWQQDSSPLSHLGSPTCYLTVDLTCISLITSNMGLLYTFFGEMSIQVFCPFKKLVYLGGYCFWGFLVFFLSFFLLLSSMSSLYIFYINHLSDIWFAIFFSICRLSFYFIDDFLCWAEAFQFDVVPSVYFFTCCLCFICQIQKIITNIPHQEALVPCFLLGLSWLQVLHCMSLIHLGLIFMSGVIQRPSSILSLVDIQLFQHYY